MIQKLKLSTVPFGLYYFKGIPFRLHPETREVVSWSHGPGWYKYLGTAIDVRTRQPRIVYVGVDGKDKDVWHVTGYLDWVQYFTYLPDSENFDYDFTRDPLTGETHATSEVQSDPSGEDRVDAEDSGSEGGGVWGDSRPASEL